MLIGFVGFTRGILLTWILLDKQNFQFSEFIFSRIMFETLHYVVQNWFQTGCDRIYMYPLFLTRDFHKAHTNKPIIHFHIHTVIH